MFTKIHTHTLCAYGIGEIPSSIRLIASINLIVERYLMEKGFSKRSVQYFLEGS